MALLTKIKTTLAIHTRRKVAGLLDGQYATTVTGRSLDFSDLREYVIGDDIKDLDWKATARHGTPLVRRYVADRKRTIALTVCAGVEMAGLANPTETKQEVAIMAAGLMGYLGTRHGDYVGLQVSGGDEVTAVRPSTREIELERMLQIVQQHCSADSRPADLTALLKFTVAAMHRRSILVLVTDDIAFDAPVEALLGRLAAQHEIYAITIGDLDPTATEPDTLYEVATGRELPGFVRHDIALARELAAADTRRRTDRAHLFASLGISHETVSACDDVIPAIFRLLGRTRHAVRR